MRHSDADRKLATERYLLGELAGDELDNFEEHMFVCQECASAVKNGVAFEETARAVFHEHPGLFAADPKVEQRENFDAGAFFRKWFTFPQVATGMALLALLGYSGLEYARNMRLERGIASLMVEAPQEPVTLAPTSRGGDDRPQTIPPNVSSFSVQLQRLPAKCMNGCTARLRDAKGRFLRGINVALPFSSDGKAVLRLTRELMASGIYAIVVGTNGPAGREEKEYSLQLL